MCKFLTYAYKVTEIRLFFTFFDPFIFFTSLGTHSTSKTFAFNSGYPKIRLKATLAKNDNFGKYSFSGTM